MAVVTNFFLRFSKDAVKKKKLEWSIKSFDTYRSSFFFGQRIRIMYFCTWRSFFNL